jgi:hypothetical protein
MGPHTWKITVAIMVVLLLLTLTVSVIIYMRGDRRLPFADVWNGNRHHTKEMMVSVINAADKKQTELFAVGDTLLGLVRHQSLVPWEDHIQLGVSDTDFKAHLPPNLECNILSPDLTRVSSRDLPRVKGEVWSWPFIDLVTYHQTDGLVHIGDEKFQVATIFPLRTNLIEGIPLNIPNDPDTVLERIYTPEWATICKTSGRSARLGREGGTIWKTACSNIKNPDTGIIQTGWVVNLKRRPERWEQTRQRLENIGIKAERWDATDSEDPGFAAIHKSFETNISPGEMACSISHRSLWKHLLDKGVSHALIFEDDIFVAPGITLEDIENTINTCRGFNILYLGYCGITLPKSNEGSVIGGAACTHAYVVSREGLKGLMEIPVTHKIPIDITIWHFCDKNLCFRAKHVPCGKTANSTMGLINQDSNILSDLATDRS